MRRDDAERAMIISRHQLPPRDLCTPIQRENQSGRVGRESKDIDEQSVVSPKLFEGRQRKNRAGQQSRGRLVPWLFLETFVHSTPSWISLPLETNQLARVLDRQRL